MLPRGCGPDVGRGRYGASGWFWVVWFGSADQGRSALPVDGIEV
jgi:hypothetical protein